MRPIRALLLSVLLVAPNVFARPLVTEEVAPIGYMTFETGAGVTYRTDKFNSPTKTYETVNVPVHMKFGVHPKAEIGFEVNYVDQKLDFGDSRLSGSTVSDFSPEFKYSPWEFAGLQGIWHTPQHEDTDTEMPIGHGDEYELLALFKIPFRIGLLQLNTGYVWKNSYPSQEGIRGGPAMKVAPGNIFETRGAWEIPILWNFNLLTELAYYKVAEQSINSQPVTDSAGEAMDALAGLTWAWGGWNIGSGFSFGLLDESHTSFDLQRGAGDWKYHLDIAYKLKPKKPTK